MQTTLTLNNGQQIPMIGYGTWKVRAEEGYQGVKHALEAGYKHIDTAEIYNNHFVIAKALQEAGVPREKLYITSKLWMDKRSSKAAQEATKQYLKELKIDYLDLLLIHWPDSSVDVMETLQGMKEVQQQGLVRSIGVSNFTENHIQPILDAGINIQMNQIELHPSLPQPKLVAFCQQHSIAVTA